MLANAINNDMKITKKRKKLSKNFSDNSAYNIFFDNLN